MPEANNVADAKRFVDAFYKIPDARVRRDILGLLKAAGDEGKTGSALWASLPRPAYCP